MELTIAAALFAGVVSFLSPCVLPVVPDFSHLDVPPDPRIADAYHTHPEIEREVIDRPLFIAATNTNPAPSETR